MDIVPLTSNLIPQAAELFAGALKRQRDAVPELPKTLLGIPYTCKKLGRMNSSFAALEKGRLVGYIGAFSVPGFRSGRRTAAYIPEWGHYAVQGDKARIYRALYRALSDVPLIDCQVHAITLLAEDAEAREAWFWNGFGGAVVDGLRSLEPVGAPEPDGFTIRKASTPADAAQLAEIEAEHLQHYQQAPVFYYPGQPDSAENFVKHLSDPKNTFWMAMDGDTVMAYLRFDGSGTNGADIVHHPCTACLNGAYTRPQYRGRGAVPALLDAALKEYAAMGYQRCSVDFESFNPEAVAFWPRYFRPVCYSLMRIPETLSYWWPSMH